MDWQVHTVGIFVIVYADRKRTVDAPELFDQLVELRPEKTEDWLEALIGWGELEAAIADAVSEDYDRLNPIVTGVREQTLAAARGLCGFNSSDGSRIAADTLAWTKTALPEKITISTPEGYAYYAVHPGDYARAAERLWRELRPTYAIVIGIRSIGTSLSAVVAAVLEQLGSDVVSTTVRPRGHPFERRLQLSPDQANQWRSAREALFVVVDEGPGLSGSSFTSVARALAECGVPESRVVFMPAWDASGGEFVSAESARVWRSHRRFVATPRNSPEGRDLSGGLWRELLYRSQAEWPPVDPRHERRKYLGSAGLWKFAGLGPTGRERFDRARELAQHGFAPEAYRLENGYLLGEFLEGRPLAATEMSRNLLDRAITYLNFRRAAFRSRREPPIQEIEAMVRVNVEESLGACWRDRALAALESCRSAAQDSETVEIDGRMLPHEWIATARGYIKTDCLDHFDDHFFPGCQSILWDIAGFLVEFEVSRTATGNISSCFKCNYEQIRYYSIAYLGYRIGYCGMAVDTLRENPADRLRFRRLGARYLRRLHQELECGREADCLR